jgi:hypothetical protein
MYANAPSAERGRTVMNPLKMSRMRLTKTQASSLTACLMHSGKSVNMLEMKTLVVYTCIGTMVAQLVGSGS